MKKPVRMHWYHRILELDAHHALVATFEEAGTFMGILLPARKNILSQEQSEQYLLMTTAPVNMHPQDRIMSANECYRIRHIRSFPGHTEAVVEREMQ